MSEQILKQNLAAIEAAEKLKDPFAKVRASNDRNLVARLQACVILNERPSIMDAEDAINTIKRLQAQVAELQAKLK